MNIGIKGGSDNSSDFMSQNASAITIGIAFILLLISSAIFWNKHRQGLPLSRLEKILMVLDIVVTVIYIALLVAEKLPPSTGFQIIIPPELSWGFLIVLVTSIVITIIVRYKQRRFIERIEKVHAYVFFPVGTPEENNNLDYHGKHFHKKLIVNFKTKPPQAYYLVAADTSYGWKLIHKYPDMWTSMEDSLYPNPDTHKWCEEKGYKLNPWNASKEELLKTDALIIEPKENTKKIEEKPTATKTCDEEQLRYRFQLKEEIDRIRLELDNVENPKDISYSVWLCDHDPERRRRLVGNNREHDFMQKFYTAIENRNRYQSSMHRLDAEFARLNAKCIDAYRIVMNEVIWQPEEESDLRQTGKELLQALYFFLEHWATYKRLMKTDSWRLESPQKGEIKWCSDQIKFAAIKARTLGFSRLNAVIDQIEAISNDMAELGMSVLQQFPVPFSAYDLERGEIQRLIVRGDAICKKLKQVIPIVEQNFIKKGKIEDVSSMLAEISEADKMDKPCIDEEPDMKQTKHKNAKEAKTPAEESKLMEVYSPIHAMIVRVNREIPREVALNGTVGAWVRASLIDFKDISAVFNQHNDKLRKKDLDMWLEIEKEIKVRNGFWLNKDRQTWFDELEAEYNRLIKHQQR